MNNRGFATLSIILWAPLLMVLSLSLMWVVWFLNQSKSLDNICYQGVMRSQEKIVQGNNQIMEMNKKAWLLFIEKKALDLTILLGPPPAKAAAKARRKIVVSRQKILRRKQKFIFRKTHFAAKAELFKLRSKMQNKVRELNQFWNSSVSFQNLVILPNHSQLKIRVYDTAPIYKRGADHERKQNIQARWQIPLKRMMPPWLLRWVPIHPLWQGQCASHSHKGGPQWQAAIGVGNHL